MKPTPEMIETGLAAGVAALKARYKENLDPDSETREALTVFTAAVLEAALSASPLEDVVRALEPFAAYAARIADDHPCWDHDLFNFHLPDSGPTMREFRRAREVYRALTSLRPSAKTETGDG